MKIVLDAGHGINTPGKRTPDDIREWTLNERVLRGFKQEIERYKGVEILRVDDSTGNTDVPLINRTNNANRFGGEVYISFHHNAYQSKWGNHGGSEAWVYPNRNSEALARVLLTSVVNTLGLRDRGVKTGNFHVNREFKGVSVLMEIGFMDSNTDKVIREEDKSLLCGKNMAIAFAKHYNLGEGNEAPKPTPTPNNATSYQRPQGTYSEKGRFTNTSGSNIYMRQYVPNVNGVFNGNLANGSSVDYQDVYVGNGFVWVGNGTTWIPTGSIANGKRNEKTWGTFGGGQSAKPIKSIDQMAREVANGDHGTGHANRQKSLGVDNATYQKVRARVNQLV